MRKSLIAMSVAAFVGGLGVASTAAAAPPAIFGVTHEAPAAVSAGSLAKTWLEADRKRVQVAAVTPVARKDPDPVHLVRFRI